MSDRITVSMPMHNAATTIRRSVQSVLNQTHTDLTLIVTNDGGPPDVWQPIDDIDDRRLVRFNLPRNGGRYRADAITLQACNTPWWTVQDADDWTEPERLARFLGIAKKKNVHAVFGGYRQHRLDGTERVVTPHRIRHMANSRSLMHVAHHTALYRTAALRMVDGQRFGPNPDYRIAWDTFMIGVVAHKLSWAIDMEPLYHHCHQPTSLMQSEATRKNSPERQRVQAELKKAFLVFYNTSRNGRQARLPKWSPAAVRDVEREAARLRKLLP